MRFSSSYIYHLLNQDKIRWLVILLATASKSLLTAIFSNYEGDKSFYLLLAKNLASGKGLTIPVSLLSDPAVTDNVYLPSGMSPLYSVLVAPLIKIFPENYFLVSWIIESLSWLLLFLVLHRLLRFLTGDNFWPNVFILFAGFFLYNIELSSTSKDVLSTALIFLALIPCLRIISLKQTHSLLSLFGIAVLFLLPGLTKFIYLPLAIVFPFILLFIYILTKQSFLLRPALWLTLFSLLLLGAYYLFFHSLETNAFRQHETFFTNRWSLAKSGDDFVRGLYPENLLQLYPYIPAAVLNLDVGGVWVRAVLPSLYRPYGIFLFIINLTGILGLAATLLIVIRKHVRKPISAGTGFFISGAIVSFSMLLIASFLSLRYHPINYKGSSGSWTYVFENRPFVFSIIFIQLLLVLFLFSRKSLSRFLYRVKIFLLLLMGISVLHGIYFIIKTSLDPSSAKETTLSINKLVIRDIEKIKKENPGYGIWLATEMQHLDWYAKLKNQKVLNHLIYLNDSSFRLPPKTILVSVLSREDNPQIKPYLSMAKTDSSWNHDGAWFIYLQKND